MPATRRRAASRDGALVRVFNDRGEYRCSAGRASAPGPGVVNGLGIWWRKLGLDGTNVNELTHQRLTDIGRAPVLRLPGRGRAGGRGRAVKRRRWRMAAAASAACCARCWPALRCA